MTATAITDRQAEVVRMIARGFTHDEIGERLGISRRTAKAHCDTLRHKLRVAKFRQIPAAYAIATGDDPYPRFVESA